MRFPKGCISVFLGALSLFSGMAESGENNAFTPRITKERTMSCPLKLDTRGMEVEKDRKRYYWQQALAEFPFQGMSGAIRLNTNIAADQVLTFSDGYFIVNDDHNSVSQLYCNYVDDNNQPVRLAFSFRGELKFHVTGHLPTDAHQVIFPNSGRLDCTATNEPATPGKPHCRGTLASLLISNQLNVMPVYGYPKNNGLYGYINYEPTMDIPEYSETPETFTEEKKKALIKPGETKFYPVSMASTHHGVTVGVRIFEAQEDVTEKCISSWLPKTHLLVKYGASPQIIISGEVGMDGNPKSGFKCELRCNEKEELKDCWDVGVLDKAGWLITFGGRSDLRRMFLLTKVNEAYEDDFSSESDEVLLRKYQAIPYYGHLGLKPVATAKEIKKAYRALSLKYHPDKGGSEEQINFISTAQTRLIDLNKMVIEEDEEDYEEGESLSDNPKRSHDEL